MRNYPGLRSFIAGEKWKKMLIRSLRKNTRTERELEKKVEKPVACRPSATKPALPKKTVVLRKCPNCNTPVRDDLKFCPNCGFNLEVAVLIAEWPPSTGDPEKDREIIEEVKWELSRGCKVYMPKGRLTLKNGEIVVVKKKK